MDIKDKIKYYEQAYFTDDLPVPFKNGLMIYPVKLKDYYYFYNLIHMFTMNKNEAVGGIGIAMSHLDYFIYLMQPQQEKSEIFTRQVIQMFELIFHIKNGIKCECDQDNDTFVPYEEIYQKIFSESSSNNNLSPEDISRLLLQIKTCPKCGKIRPDLIKFNELPNGKKDLIIDNVEITKNDFDELRKIVCYQNIPDYEDEYIDPDLKRNLDEQARLENPNMVQPTLEKQKCCLVSSTGYKYSELSGMTIRRFVMLLRTVDAKLHYFAYRQAEAGGMVKFGNELQHWIYGSDKHNKMDKLIALDSFKDKMSQVAK